MLKYVPHRENNHSWRTALFVFFVVLISTGGAYFVTANQGIFQKKVDVGKVPEDQLQKPEAINPALQAEDATEIKNDINANLVSESTVDTLLEKKESLSITPVERNKNPATRLDEAKMYAKPQIVSGKYIDISLKYQNMVIFQDGQVLDAYQISSGKKGMDTPIGTFKIENKSPKAWSKGYGLWMPNWMAFLPSGEIGIHELPIWPGGYQEGANHLGTPVSHGCIRLGKGSAKTVYDWAEIGTPVIVHL